MLLPVSQSFIKFYLFPGGWSISLLNVARTAAVATSFALCTPATLIFGFCTCARLTSALWPLHMLFLLSGKNLSSSIFILQALARMTPVQVKFLCHMLNRTLSAGNTFCVLCLTFIIVSLSH